jgi:hypothetical protein
VECLSYIQDTECLKVNGFLYIKWPIPRRHISLFPRGSSLHQLNCNQYFRSPNKLSRTTRLAGRMLTAIPFSTAPLRYTIRRCSVSKDFLNDRALEYGFRADILLSTGSEVQRTSSESTTYWRRNYFF